MNMTILLEKLIEIERFIGAAPDSVIRNKVIDVEDCILTLQKEIAEGLRHPTVVATTESPFSLNKNTVRATKHRLSTSTGSIHDLNRPAVQSTQPGAVLFSRSHYPNPDSETALKGR